MTLNDPALDTIIQNGSRVVPMEWRPRYFALLASAVSRLGDEQPDKKRLRFAVTTAIAQCRQECAGCDPA